MKTLLILWGLLGYINFLQAQTWEEWTQQRKTQTRYLLQQIAAFRIYTNYLYEGYELARKGQQVIKEIKEGDFHLHRDYFYSLKSVNPVIASSAKVVAILAVHKKIIHKAHQAMKELSAIRHMRDAERACFQNVLNHLLEDCSGAIGQLQMIISSGTVNMNDAERIRWLDNLYTDILQKHILLQSFINDASILQVQRKNDQSNIGHLQRILDVP